MLGSNSNAPIGDITEDLRRQLRAALGSLSNVTGIARNVIEGEFKDNAIVFKQPLPSFYVIWVNGVSFKKNHFPELTANSIELNNYIQEGDLVQLEFLELL